MEDDLPLIKPSKSNLEEEKGLPWFDRNQLKGLINFGSDKTFFEVILTDQVVRDLREGTLKRSPQEAYGQLMGRAYFDNNGPFTVVSGVVYAEDLDASPGHVRLSPEQMRKLRYQATRKYPAESFVGWTHSHGGYGQYSSTDYKEQKTWEKDYHVGILTFMRVRDGEPWAEAYRGPNAFPLYLPRTQFVLPPLKTRSSPNPSTDVLFTPKGLEPAEPRNPELDEKGGISPPFSPEDGPVPKKTPKRRFRLVFNMYLLVILCFLLAMVLFGWLLLNINSNIQALPSRLVQPTKVQVLPFPMTTSLPWNCETESQSLKVVCNGPVGPNISGWIWNFGDLSSVQNSTTSSIVYSYKHSGTYTVMLTILTSYGKQETGSATLTITAPPNPTPSSTAGK